MSKLHLQLYDILKLINMSQKDYSILVKNIPFSYPDNLLLYSEEFYKDKLKRLL